MAKTKQNSMSDPSPFLASKTVSPCATCKRRINPEKCEAFPKGIPMEILTGGHLHRTPYPGDNGLQYKVDRGKMAAQTRREEKNQRFIKEWEEEQG
jgi:hypothetical protein